MTNLWTSLFKRGSSTGPEAEEIKALSDQFRITLRASAGKVKPGEETRGVLQHVRELLAKDDWHWKDAYEVEQQLVLLYDAETLRTELARRILEAKHVLYPDAASWYKERLDEADTEQSQRALLLRLVNDLQWRYTVNEAKLGYVKQITGRTGWIFIIAMISFVAFLLLLFLESQWQQSGFAQLTRFLTFLLAGVSGFLGAAFSMVSSLKARLEAAGLNQLKNASSKAILFSRVLVGTGAAMILYFFFESGLLAGEAFPELVDATGKLDDSAGVRALLIVWCFIAGFSEKLVPGLLAKTEASAGVDDAQTMSHAAEAAETIEAPRAKDTAAAEEEAAASEEVEDQEPGDTAKRDSGSRVRRYGRARTGISAATGQPAERRADRPGARRALARRTMPSFFIRERSVLKCMPSFSAAPPLPATWPPQRSSTVRMCRRSTSCNVRTPLPSADSGAGCAALGLFARSGSASRSTRSVEASAARSTTFLSSRTLPGQEYASSWRITSAGTSSSFTIRYKDWKLHFTMMDGALPEAYLIKPAWPRIVNIRMDPYERFLFESRMYLRWCIDQMWTMVPQSTRDGSVSDSKRPGIEPRRLVK